MISDLPFQPELQISAIRLYQTEIPFQLSFNHATQQRAAVTGIVLQFTSACGRHGFGEVLPRAYVSGETDASVVAALARRGAAGARRPVLCQRWRYPALP